MRRLILTLMMVSITAIWGWTFVVVKDAAAAMGVVPFLAVRFTIAAAAMAPFAERGMTRDNLRVGGAIGLVLGVAYAFQTFGLAETTATNAGMITGMFVVFAPLTGWIFFRVRTSPSHWAMIGVSLLGLMLLTGAAPAGVSRGDWLTLACAAFFGLHLAMLGRFAAGRDAAALTLAQLGVTALLFLIAWPFCGPFRMPTPWVWFALLLTGLVASALGFFVQTFVQQRLSAVETALIIVTEPIFAALFGYWLHHDRLEPLQIVGAALMVAAFAAVQLAPILYRNGRKRPTARELAK